MKITDYMQNAMDILRNEFDLRTRRGENAPCDLNEIWDDDIVVPGRNWTGGYVHRPIFTLGVEVDDFLTMAGAEKASGANSMALIFDEGVVKWDKGSGIESHYTTNEDAWFYQSTVEQFPKYRAYLAETIQVGQFTVQEPIRASHEVINELNDDERFDIYATIIRVAHELGLRDIHMGNWGFRGDDLTTPVIFDFSDRREPGSNMSWNRLNAQFDWNDWQNCGRDYNQMLERMLDELNDFALLNDSDDDEDYNTDF